ncbi:MAG: hypothetical protein KatS3mg111_2430 [Pirellulaceae bacterium]|nr:MAG: hypothetical protein KatS3mg111_2430 [Pirellulaceae bacterium]
MKNAALIGQLVNCPKCQSLLLVEPPRQVTVTASNGDTVDSTALTRDEISATIEPGNRSSVSPAPGVAEHSPERIGEEVSAQRPRSAGNREGDPSERCEDQAMAAGSVPFDGEESPSDLVIERPIDPEQWASPRSKKVRNYLLVAFAGLASTVVAVVVFMAFLSWQRRQPTPSPATAEHNIASNGGMGSDEAEGRQEPDQEPGGQPLDGEGLEANDAVPAVAENSVADGSSETASGMAESEDRSADAAAASVVAGGQPQLPNDRPSEPVATTPLSDGSRRRWPGREPSREPGRELGGRDAGGHR